MASVFKAFEESDNGRHEYRVPAAEKALDILEFMAMQGDPLTQTEIANGLGRSIHEVYRILLLLEKREYLKRTGVDRFRLSLKLFELAHMHPPVNRLVEHALPVMQELAENIDQSCHLVVLRGEQVLVVLQTDSPLPIRYSVALGSHFPILETSAGAVLLAHRAPREREILLNRIFASGGENPRRNEIEARLDQAARLGYEMRPSLAVDGCTNICLPIRDHTNSVIAALSVPFLPQKAARFDSETVFKRTAVAAEQISAALGAGDGTDNQSLTPVA